MKSETSLDGRFARTEDRRTLFVAIALCIAAEAVLDSLTPLGFSDWMFYVIPVFLTSWLTKEWTTRVAPLVSVLAVVGLFLSPRSALVPHLTWVSVFNRTIGVGIFWITALLVNRRRRALEDVQRTHEELEKKTEKLIETERLKTEFLADTSHELRSPLAIIKSHLDLASGKKTRKLVDPYKTFKSINVEVEHISQIIADLILLTRSISGPHHVLVSEEVRLDELITATVKKYRPLARNKKITITTALSANTYQGDSEKLEKLFSNLLSNAIRYGRENGRVDIAARRDAETVTIEFKDDGIGISKEDLPRIFERFYRVEKARTRGGVGLGLAICKWVAEAHGGSVSASSVLHKGSVFTVTLPLSRNLQMH